MLTSVYYYGYYKPYILKNYNLDKIADIKNIKKQQRAEPEKNNEAFVLNKALKNGVINYANKLSDSIIKLKESSKNFIRDTEMFHENAALEGEEYAKEAIAEDISGFVEAYNLTNDFTEQNSDSQSLVDYTQYLNSDVSESKKRLARYGVGFLENGKLSFEKTDFNKLDFKRMDKINKSNLEFFKNTYDSTGEFLKMPLAEHMNFKSLGYYYNYKLGTVEKDTFKIIETGLIVDKAV